MKVEKDSPKQAVNSNASTQEVVQNATPLSSNPEAFLSPLIISIAQKENLSLEEVQSIEGTGAEGRIRKSDVFNYLKNRKYPLQRLQVAAVAPQAINPALSFF